MGGPAIRVLCVDDHRLMREGIARIVGVQTDMTVVAQASDGPTDETAGGLGGDAQALADLAEALALAVEQPEAGFDLRVQRGRERGQALRAGTAERRGPRLRADPQHPLGGGEQPGQYPLPLQ